jgi:hypothetical protein
VRLALVLALLTATVPIPALAAAPMGEMQLSSSFQFWHGMWTDAEGVPCLSDENLWNRTWTADRFTGSMTASLYLCPENPNAPSGSDNYSLWAAFATANGNGAMSLTLTYPDGMVIPARFNPATGWTEVCVLDPLAIPAGVYSLTLSADRARSPIVNFETSFAESVRGQYWWGCDQSWGSR